MTKKFFGLCLCAMAVAGLTLSSCSSDEPDNPDNGTAPTLTFSSSNVNVAQAGGSASFTYTLTNSASDGVFSCTADVDWVYDFNTSTSGSVSFSVDANDSYDARTATVTLTYSCSAGTASGSVRVIQDAAEIPTIDLSTVEIAASFLGGDYDFTYTVSNGTGTVSLSADVDWITGLTDNSGAVSFSVAQSESDDVRTGIVTVTLDFGSGTQTANVTVTQEAAPSLTGTVHEVSASGYPGSVTIDLVSKNVDINGDNPGLYYSYSSEDDEWIDIGTFWVDATYTDIQAVEITWDGNTTGAERQGTLIIWYGTIDDEGYADPWITYSITVTQEALPELSIDVSDLGGTYTATATYYNGNVDAPTVGNWTVTVYNLYNSDDYSLLPYVEIDGLSPQAAGYFDPFGDQDDEDYYSTEAYVGIGEFTEYKQLAIPTQITGYYNSYYSLYYGWTPCTEYSGGTFYYSSLYPDCTFTYDENSGKWESDYGLFFSLMDVSFSSNVSWPYFYSDGENGYSVSLYTYYDAVAPTIVWTKNASTDATAYRKSISDSNFNQVAHPLDEGRKLHRDFKVQKDGTVLHAIDTIRKVAL